MFSNILLVAVGGACGTILRYLCQKGFNTSYPYGTMGINLAGCFLIGLLWSYLTKNPSDHLRLLLMTGLCGGFTTFSSFSHEGMVMIFENRWLEFFIYTSVSVVGGLTATYLGFKILNF